MTKDFPVKPKQEILLNYFSVELHQMDTIRYLEHAMRKVCGDINDSVFEMFYLFGAADVLLLGIGNTCKTLREMQDTRAYQNVNGVMDYFTHHGTVLSVHPESFEFHDALKENKMLGIIHWKIRNEVWLEVLRAHNSIETLRKSLAVLLDEICEQSRKESEPSVNYKVISVFSSGCEDIILIVLTNSLRFPKLLSTKIRALELKSFMGLCSTELDITHVSASTNTISGAQIKKNDFIYADSPLTPGKQIQDKLKWSSCFNVRPGHLQNAIDAIKGGCLKETTVCPIVGRHDLIACTPLDKVDTSAEFLQSHRHLINQLTHTHSILSSETHLFFPTLEDTETTKTPDKALTPLSVIEPLKAMSNEIYESPDLHILEKESLAQIVRKLEYLLQDRYLVDSFLTLMPIIVFGIQEYIELRRQKCNTSITTDLWTSLVELCFVTRYKGSTPVGESAVCPTLGSYSTGVKWLTMLDLLANRIIKRVIEQSPEDMLPICVVNTCINSYTAVAIPTMPIKNTFFLLPPRPLFYPQFLILTFLHELGHVVFDSFALPANANLSPRVVALVQCSLEEPVAELFSIKMLSKMNFDQHKENTKTGLQSLKVKPSSHVYKELHETKNQHIDGAESLYELAKLSTGEERIGQFLIGGLRNKPKISQQLTDDIHCIAKTIIGYIKFLDSWEDEIVDKVRTFFKSDNTQEEFWKLWIYLHNLGEDLGEGCYYDPDTK